MRAGPPPLPDRGADAPRRQGGRGPECGSAARASYLADLAETHGGTISVPTGALVGLDAGGAAAEGEIRSLRLTARKPPGSLAGAPGIEASGVDRASLTEPVRVFAGGAGGGAGLPANLNVAAALSLAGPGPDRTEVEIWADPAVTRNTHDRDGVRRC